MELSDKLGISYSTLGSYERGKRTPSIDFLLLLSDKLNVNPNWILNGTGDIFVNTKKNTLKRRNSNFTNIQTSKIGFRLTEIQEKNNLHDKDMANILDMYQDDYMDLKCGCKEPTLKILVKIKQSFDVSIDWLLYGEYR